MSKERKSNKEQKKAPQKTNKEKRLAKKDKSKSKNIFDL